MTDHQDHRHLNAGVDADPDCQLCHGQGTRMVTGHTFNPALGRPLALVWCECRLAIIEERQRAYRAELDASLDAVTTEVVERLAFVQSDEWDRRNGLGPNATQDIYSDSNCCYCFRKTKPDAARLAMIRTHDGNWWLIAPTAPIRNDEWDRFALPVGPECLRQHPEWRFAIAERVP